MAPSEALQDNFCDCFRSSRCLTRARRQRPSEELTEAAGIEPAPGDRLDAVRLLATLAPRQRAALYLTWIEGCTDREAGRLLGLRPATVRVPPSPVA